MGHLHAEHDSRERSPNSNCLVRDTAAMLALKRGAPLGHLLECIRAEKSKSLGNFTIWHEIATSARAFLLVPITSNNLECPQGVLTAVCQCTPRFLVGTGEESDVGGFLCSTANSNDGAPESPCGL
jgi:hypothetical protein